MDVLIVNHEEVREILDMKSAINVMKSAFTAFADGGITPPRAGMAITEDKLLSPMLAHMNSLGKAGIKVTTVFSGNSGSEYNVHQGAVLVFEEEHGCLEAIVDAAEITNIRTAAASGLATRLLANPNSENLIIIGAGTQGRVHLEAMLAVLDFKRITVWDLSYEAAKRFADNESKKYGLIISVANDFEQDIRDADVICISTPSTEPVLRGEWVTPGTHINSVGYSGPTGRELDNALLKKSRIYVDSKQSIFNDCGDMIIPIAEGIISKADIVGDLSELLTKKSEGRVSPQDITLYKSAGVAIQDLMSAHYIHQQALKRGMGTTVTIGGLNI